ncbi:TraV family lipoprotein [Thioalkalivibrio thiocyanodenitrificans]|uniref:TraV family lipoprotein n=1 Tax=Thioalkalivibrio thiocyanodenitrificans TaxID=243063 RepID=UPI0003753C3C|nr:TraV family lipoprotein [Thioalkalivibrio thiocyanodenitrificans]
MKPYQTLILIGAVSLFAAGCASSPSYSCPLNSAEGYCKSLEDTHSAALGDFGSRENVHERSGANGGQSAERQGVVGERVFPGFPMPDERGKPVYTPPSVHQLWIAPYQSAEGVLHGGEYLYFTTEGYWNFGTLTAPGEGAGVITPLRPENLGFNPKSPEAQTSSDDADAEVRERAGIVQPHERLVPNVPR